MVQSTTVSDTQACVPVVPVLRYNPVFDCTKIRRKEKKAVRGGVEHHTAAALEKKSAKFLPIVP